jgi:D-cysteine desulfhydrase family pyridoxal phosphate-dependent enzyme
MIVRSLTRSLPRVPLAFLPTPLSEMPRLRAALPNCPRLLIKRDDQTGLATGGNKTRKLEFLIGQALAGGADTIVTVGCPQSNHCRQTAAAATLYGLRCILVVSGEPEEAAAWNGNLLLDDLLGAEVRWTCGRDRDVVVNETVDELRQNGSRPYVIPTGGSVPVGAAGYVAAVEEVAVQLTRLGDILDRIIVVSGSGGTHAGVLVGVRALGWATRVEGMNNFAVPDIAAVVKTLTRDTADYLGLDLVFAESDFRCHDACGSHAYGVITDAEREAIRLMARKEAILLDPVYTGRAFAHLVAQIRAGDVYRPNETLLFWHTGGTAGLFPRAQEMLADE